MVSVRMQGGSCLCAALSRLLAVLLILHKLLLNYNEHTQLQQLLWMANISDQHNYNSRWNIRNITVHFRRTWTNCIPNLK